MVTPAELKSRIHVAMGDEPADTLFVNGKVVSTFTEEIVAIDLAVSGGRIVALGDVVKAKTTVDLKGAYICPSLIDAHIHVESSMLSPEGFAEAVVPHGTGATVSDPHEIVNVFGLKGLEYMVKASQNLPLDIFYTIPSCVPATHMETSGGAITARDIPSAYKTNPSTPALSEMMNFPGVCFADDGVLEKICAAQQLGLPIDGHAPMLKGKQLNAYLNAHISTDHECTSAEEALEKLRRGMYVLIREGSAARNLKDLLPVLTDRTAHRICIATDDAEPYDLVEKGHLDYIWKEMIRLGVDPIRALRVLSLNPALAYHLSDRGGLGIGYLANFIVVEDLKKPVVKMVYHRGVKVAENGALTQPLARKEARDVLSSVHLPKDLSQKLQKFPGSGQVKIIGVIEGQLVTESLTGKAEDVRQGELAYLAVVERHGKNGQVGLGFVKGLGLKAGALASTVAHDHHNLILLGKNLPDMEAAAKAVEKTGGGFVVVENGQVKASLPLTVGGLMSGQSARDVVSRLHEVEKAAKDLGVTIHSPFMVLSFLALSVIPHLKLTDMGLVDVDKFALVPLTSN